MMKKKQLKWVAMLLGLSCVPGWAGASDIERGRVIFQQLCIHCHKAGYDEKFGPGLGGILERRDEAWLDGFLRDPEAMINKDEYAKTLQESNTYHLTMPKLREMQDAQLRADVIAFMGTLK